MIAHAPIALDVDGQQVVAAATEVRAGTAISIEVSGHEPIHFWLQSTGLDAEMTALIAKAYVRRHEPIAGQWSIPAKAVSP